MCGVTLPSVSYPYPTPMPRTCLRVLESAGHIEHNAHPVPGRASAILADILLPLLIACGNYFRRPAPFLVGSTSTYPMPGFGVGGIGLSRVTVRSSPVRPPREPTISYWPERGAGAPGFSGLLICVPPSPHPGLTGSIIPPDLGVPKATRGPLPANVTANRTLSSPISVFRQTRTSVRGKVYWDCGQQISPSGCLASSPRLGYAGPARYRLGGSISRRARGGPCQWQHGQSLGIGESRGLLCAWTQASLVRLA